jgi:hypothetical protein
MLKKFTKIEGKVIRAPAIALGVCVVDMDMQLQTSSDLLLALVSFLSQ